MLASPATEPWAVVLADGATQWEARRLPKAASGRAAVELRAGERRFNGEVDATAIVRVPVGAVPSLPGVVVDRALMPEAGLWAVRSAKEGEDGLALAERLVKKIDGRTLLAVSPNFWLPHVLHNLNAPPNDTRYGGQWYLKKIGIESAWKLTSGEPSIEVTVVDDGCDLQHPDLVTKLLPGRDVVTPDDDPTYIPNQNGNEHGTACAGIVAAATNNNTGIAGTCPECKLRCVRLLSGSGELVPITADVDAFSFAMSSGSAVVSNSWGFGLGVPVPPPLKAAITTAVTVGRGGKGLVVVFAAGNAASRLKDDELPSVPGIITVGAINNFDEAAPFSNRGPSVALTAPTGTVTLDISGPQGHNATDVTVDFGGTSSSCPVVAGVAGLMLSANPLLTAAQVREALIQTARPAPFAVKDDAGHDELYGYGIVDPTAALLRVRPDWVDAGQPDAGTTDAGMVTVDAGPSVDAGGAGGGAGGSGGGAEPAVMPRGCGCDGSAGQVSFLLAAAAAVWVTWRRRSG